MTHEQKMNEKIFPCPFCGSKRVEVSRTNKNACWIECRRCGATAKGDATRKKAIALWNRRPNYDGYAKIVFDMDAEHEAWQARQKEENQSPAHHRKIMD